MFNILKQKLTRDDAPEEAQALQEPQDAAAASPVEAPEEPAAPDAASLFHSISFIDLEVEDILTPAEALTCVRTDDPPVTVSKTFRESGFSCLPVCEGEPARVSGIVREKDFHYQVLGGGKTLAAVTLEPLRIAPDCKLSALLPQLATAPAHLAVVEDGSGLRGVVTLHDALRAVFS